MPSVANSLSPFPTAWHGSISSQLLRCFSTTKYPSRTKMTDERQQQNQKIASGVGSKTNHAETTSGDTRSKESSSTEKVQRFKSTRRKDWKKDYATQRNTTPKAVPVVQPSIYYYCTQPAYPLGVEEQSTDERLSSRFVLPTMNASALLDPLKYCKNSSRLSDDSRGVSRSISGTDAARRLLRGKKDFIVAARSLKSQPAVLEGHGVPQKLFQHCIDMADALLLQFSPDVVECTFHNYNYATAYSKLPSLLRVRRYVESTAPKRRELW